MHMKTHTHSLFVFAFCATLITTPLASFASYGDTSTFVGKIMYGNGHDRLEAIFDFPEDIAITAKGSVIVADTYNNAIRKITPDGTVKRVAGKGGYGLKNGKEANAEFALPQGVAVGQRRVYVADTDNDVVRKIYKGKVKTIAEGLNGPEDVAVFGTTVYILDTGNGSVKKVQRGGGTVSTVATGLSNPKKMDITADGQFAYVANAGTYEIIRVNLSTGAKLSIAGTGDKGDEIGSCSDAKFNQIWGIHVFDDNTLYVSDGNGYDDSVKKVNLSGCTVEYFAQDSGMTSVNFPRGMDTFDGQLYLAATGLSIIQRFDLSNSENQELYAGAERFNVKDSDPILVGQPKFMLLSKNGKKIYFTENNRIRVMKKEDPTEATLIAGTVVDNYAPNDHVTKYGTDARFSDPTAMALSENGEKLFVVDRNNHRIREVEISTGGVSYLTGAGNINFTSGQDNGFANGDACPDTFDTNVDGCAYFQRPFGAVISNDGEYLYVTDTGNQRVRRVDVKGDEKGRVITIAGNGEEGFDNGTGTDATFHTPMGITMSTDGNTLYVADRDNHAIRKIDIASRAVTTLIGTGNSGYQDAEFEKAVLSYPESVTFGEDGKLYFSEVGSFRIRLVDFDLEVTKLVSGSGTRGFQNGTASEAKFNNPKGLLKLKNTLLVAELYNDMIRKIDVDGEAPFSDPAPTVTGIYVANVCDGSTCTVHKSWSTDGTLSIVIKGSNFRHGARGWVGPYESTVYVTNESELVLRMPISSITPDNYTIRITNSDGQYGELAHSLTIAN